jgi:hypothetical protein
VWGFFCLFFAPPAPRQQHGRENRDDGDDDQKFNESERNSVITSRGAGIHGRDFHFGTSIADPAVNGPGAAISVKLKIARDVITLLGESAKKRCITRKRDVNSLRVF